MPAQDLATSAAFMDLLGDVRRDPSGTLILLIRPDGVPAHDLAARLARDQGVRHGKLPLPGFGALDFHLLGEGR